MESLAFQRALQATGFLTGTGGPVPGLTLRENANSPRLRTLLHNPKVGLCANAVFCTDHSPITVFKDSAKEAPTPKDIRNWHEAAWNLGAAPLLWVVTPREVQLYNCYESPRPCSGQTDVQHGPVLGRYSLGSAERMEALKVACGRLATETGTLWSGPIGKQIDRRYRVDRELLAEIGALEQRLTTVAKDLEPGCARHLAQLFIGRCIFAWYLMDRELVQRFLPDDLPQDLGEMFATPGNAFRLFDWLHTVFNGDLFPIRNPGFEREHLSDGHLALIRDFIQGYSLVPPRQGQRRLFRFRFDAIPIDLISSIYQQFARSTAAWDADVQGLHYTPVEVVQLIHDQVFEGLSEGACIIDPTCGSGAFLVDALRRLVWRATGGGNAPRQVVRRILHRQIYGIDINPAALSIAAFSLYLAALELDADPVRDIGDLKFDRLIGSTLFQADSLSAELPEALARKGFDAVVGNPPWTYAGKESTARQREGAAESVPRPRRSPDQRFLSLADRLARGRGTVGMVLKATPFYSKDTKAIEARQDLFERFHPCALVNLSQLRRDDLFPDAVAPALVFFARCAMPVKAGHLLAGTVPWSPDFRRTGRCYLGPGVVRSVSLKRVRAVPGFLKAACFGTPRDGRLLERLASRFPTMEEVLSDLGHEVRASCGQGIQVGAESARRSVSPQEYSKLPVLKPGKFSPFRVKAGQLESFKHQRLERPRRISLFRQPLLLCPESLAARPGTQKGRYVPSVSDSDLIYSASYFGISFATVSSRFAYLLSGILASSAITFQLALGGPNWGLERPTVKPHNLLSLRIPSLRKIEPIFSGAVVEAEAYAAQNPADTDRLTRLDESVFNIYDLDSDERLICTDSIERARHFVFESRHERARSVEPPSQSDLLAFGTQVVRSIDAYLTATGTRHLEAFVYPKLVQRGLPGITAVQFIVAPGGPSVEPMVRVGNPDDLKLDVMDGVSGELGSGIAPSMSYQRERRVYGEHDLVIIRPSERRYWTVTAGLNDADTILADHWETT